MLDASTSPAAGLRVTPPAPSAGRNRRALGRSQPAIDDELAPGHERRTGGGQVERRIGDLLRGGEAAERLRFEADHLVGEPFDYLAAEGLSSSALSA